MNEDGTFKSAGELEKLYVKEQGLKRRSATIAYCRIGERSSHTWFVLKYLLGFHNVRQLRRIVDRMGQHRGRPHRPRHVSLGRFAAEPAMIDDPQTTGDRPGERLSAIAGEFKELEPASARNCCWNSPKSCRRCRPIWPPRPSAPAHRIQECQTPVFIWVDVVDGRVRLAAEVAPESPTVKGFVSILIDLFSGVAVADALALDANVVAQLGLIEALGMMRMRGLQAMQFYIRNRIAAHAAGG